MGYRSCWLLALVVVLGGATGCSGANPLNTADFDARTIAVVANIPGAPYFADELHPNLSWNSYGPERPVLFDPAVLTKDKRKPVRAQLDSALAYVDFTERIAGRVLIETASHLGCRPVADPGVADYVLRVDLNQYGFQASRRALTGFYVEAELRLIDTRTGERIWKETMQETVRAAAVLADLMPRLGKISRVKDLARLSVEEMVLVLEATADFTATRLTAALRHDYSARR